MSVPARPRCAGLNRFGQQCRKSALPGFAYCSVHRHLQAEPVAVELVGGGPFDGRTCLVQPTTRQLQDPSGAHIYARRGDERGLFQYLGDVRVPA